jgi:peroxiredoxin
MKKKGRFAASLFLIIAALSFGHGVMAQTPGSFHIDGTIEGLDRGMVMLSYNQDQKDITDSSVISGGHFHFEGSVASPVSAFLSLKNVRNQGLNFYLENSIIQMSGKADDLESAKITGSESNRDLDSIKKFMASYYDCLTALRVVSKYASTQNLASVKENVNKIYDALPGALRTLIVDYALAHPESYAITTRLFISFTNDQTDLPRLKKVYDQFSGQVKNSEGGKEIAALMKRMERVQTGRKAPDFVINDIHGNPVKFSAFTGKYVLLDFWASWCVPCREETPFLVRAFQKYKDRNFTIVSISMDTQKDRQKWLDAIDKDHMSWINVSSLKGYGEEGVRQLYSVQGIPDNFLIDPAGNIVARGLRGDDLERTLSSVIK